LQENHVPLEKIEFIVYFFCMLNFEQRLFFISLACIFEGKLSTCITWYTLVLGAIFSKYFGGKIAHVFVVYIGCA
jgi:hypothetical protein